ncbi:hypothetical protein PR048_009208 [Dryococelus australis]|uniref:HTH CENPB-type domain-containing protein n=1 Tax=Dryococelus australis TaxID=614101 RepID=A0ABQ9HZ79_9NEOP|nr:hypothetical protein PR048_009208 [Dryococelus australis]
MYGASSKSDLSSDLEDVLNGLAKNGLRVCQLVVLKAKASDMALGMQIEYFKCSEDWLHRFKERRGITLHIVFG